MTTNFLLVGGTVAAIATGITMSAQAESLTTPQAKPPTVKMVLLSYEAEAGKSCPRKITMRASALTDGPGPVSFVIRKAGGGASGQMVAVAKKAPTGKYVATSVQHFSISKSERTRYMAETGPGKISKWITFDEKCSPPRDKTAADGSGPGKPGGAARARPVPSSALNNRDRPPTPATSRRSVHHGSQSPWMVPARRKKSRT